MSNGDTHVRPGEVISSSLINQILDRLAALEAGQGTGSPPTGGGPVVIDHFEPQDEIEVGRLLAIIGSGLPFPPTGTSVTIGGFAVPVNAFLETSTSGRLELVVPGLGTVPPEGRDLFVRVRNGPAAAQQLYRFLPAVDTTPPPSITGVHPPGQPNATPVQIGTACVVDGSNFASNASNNQITLQPLPDGQVYPQPGNPLQIDASQSGPAHIAFTIPDMAEITGPPVRVRLQVIVPPNPTPAVTDQFFVFR
jgi:hypothetical protein